MEQNHNPLYPAINRVSEKLPPQERLVFDCMVELCGLPDANFGVKIADDTGKRMKEAKHSRELAENEFFIDYTHGYAHFHRKMEGRVVTIEEMYSRGLLYYPASRIYMGCLRTTGQRLRRIYSSVVRACGLGFFTILP